MNDFPRPVPADDAALLAAYLDAELDAEAADALETRLAAEPALAEELETLRELRELLGGVSAPAPPAGFEARIAARLDVERTALAAPGAATTDVTSLAAERQRRRPISWGAMGGIAAALVAVALVGANVLTQGGADMAMDTAGDAEPDSAERFFAETTDDDAQAADGADDFDSDEAEVADDSVATMEAPVEESAEADQESLGMGPAGARPDAPVITSDGLALADEEAVRAHLHGRPEAEGLLGVAGDDATDTAASFRVAVQRADPFASGVAPDACLDTVASGTGGPIAPVRVEEITYDGQPSLLYLLVTASGDAFDRVEGWVVDPDTCGTGLFVNLT